MSAGALLGDRGERAGTARPPRAGGKTMRSIIQPVTQKWLTNVSIVSHVVGGVRFEVACYCNKILAFRNGLEKELSEVLQTDAVFSDAAHGVVHRDEALLRAFGTANREVVCREILLKGRTQQSGLERRTETERRLREIACLAAARTRNPLTGLPYPADLVLSTMHSQLHYRLNEQPASAQAAYVVRQLSELAPMTTKSLEASLELPLSSARRCLEELARRVGREDFRLLGPPFIERQTVLLRCEVAVPCFRLLRAAARGAGGQVSLHRTFVLRLR